MSVEATRYLTPEEYLEGEKESSIRHEYIRGQVFAMAGAADAHEAIVVNLVALVRSRLREAGCRGYAGGMKARIEAVDIFYYPDLMVTCDERDQATATFKRYPRLVVEVLSESTEVIDRGRKLEHYRLVETLQEYVLVAQDRVHVDLYRRHSESAWMLTSVHEGEMLNLNSIGFECPVEAMYEDVDFPAEADAMVRS